MPQLGLGLGLHKGNLIQSAQQQLIRSSDFYLSADKADGQPWEKLEPRTLPNGVSNSDYTQNVSVDVVLQASDVTVVTNNLNVAFASILKKNDDSLLNNSTTSLSTSQR